jgi:predicted acetyltransferase
MIRLPPFANTLAARQSPLFWIDMTVVELLAPSLQHIGGYEDALRNGWSPDTHIRPTRDIGAEHLAAIREDSILFVRELTRENRETSMLFDGTPVPAMRESVFWVSDGDFCGAISLRFLPGTVELPPQVSGHVSYTIVPWKRRRGYARLALKQLFPIAGKLGLPRLLLTTHEDNEYSRRVIEASGGILAGAIPHPEEPGKHRLLFWVTI